MITFQYIHTIQNHSAPMNPGQDVMNNVKIHCILLSNLFQKYFMYSCIPLDTHGAINMVIFQVLFKYFPKILYAIIIKYCLIFFSIVSSRACRMERNGKSFSGQVQISKLFWCHKWQTRPYKGTTAFWK